MLHEKLEEYNSAFEKIMKELEEPEMPEDPKTSAPSTTDETPKKIAFDFTKPTNSLTSASNWYTIYQTDCRNLYKSKRPPLIVEFVLKEDNNFSKEILINWGKSSRSFERQEMPSKLSWIVLFLKGPQNSISDPAPTRPPSSVNGQPAVESSYYKCCAVLASVIMTVALASASCTLTHI
ncbi:hypothetical protein PHYBLDRAFT_141944 [Phycomyces blakesleeanus NRRL 1555(-)]|uniref:Uncharacterized protein n=1 Tax=Phycomyces blakesleeanus (strain ATCC 8743b / DSM 1359 / FGSC 10004 / NBRC 33097 / NRRL 1555) TaxID=763407 RepID=A0A163B3C4_PHYB8|nr:hypothetical protein PHYBLDRAFT_141944 [Phycomyces blakesleeanus NRRL 1555(-)]OAD78081.1 hypothetical protein PHYBLDRAFT_141944 [Phycomyces blakesleeanus NRRL 1555(-)]|eukprot:XP_018296121.1 hypothetical protein PHYBLDRAFT_141944 [Phycomyces blakesleeanus NRRL 1555(-)]